jgi:hypothetical protein
LLFLRSQSSDGGLLLGRQINDNHLAVAAPRLATSRIASIPTVRQRRSSRKPERFSGKVNKVFREEMRQKMQNPGAFSDPA